MDFHILTQAKNQNTVNVVFHIPIPATNNEVGITWQQAVVKEAGGVDNIISVLPDISSAELISMKSGALIEKVETVRFSSIYLDNAQRLQQVKDRYNVVKIEFIAEKQITLAFMGFGGNV
ncbi:hypothetical protein KAU11_00205 [Candidatus Babeliales bacterium]|nr:hypothetical protein [Candidatus Babeliales bacterium]